MTDQRCYCKEKMIHPKRRKRILANDDASNVEHHGPQKSIELLLMNTCVHNNHNR